MMQTQYISVSKVMEYTQVGFVPDFLTANVCQSFSFSTEWLSTFVYMQIKEAAFSITLWRDMSNTLHIKKQLCNNDNKRKKKKKKKKNSSSAFISLIKYTSEVTDSISY